MPRCATGARYAACTLGAWPAAVSSSHGCVAGGNPVKVALARRGGGRGDQPAEDLEFGERSGRGVVRDRHARVAATAGPRSTSRNSNSGVPRSSGSELLALAHDRRRPHLRGSISGGTPALGAPQTAMM